MADTHLPPGRSDAPAPADEDAAPPAGASAEFAWEDSAIDAALEDQPYSPYRGTNIAELATRLRMSLSMLTRRLRQLPIPGGLTLPEASALSRLDRLGSATTAALARMEQISPQSMGTTLAKLEARGLIAKEPDEYDGRRVVLRLTDEGLHAVRKRREGYSSQLSQVLFSEFDRDERAVIEAAVPLLQRLADRL